MITSKTLLISGWGTSASPMEEMAERIGLRNYEALSLKDLYEQGRKGLQKEGGGMSVYASGLAKVIQQCDTVPNVLGWSTGGVVALETVARNPANCRRLVLLSSTPRFCGEESFAHGTSTQAVRAMIMGLKKQSKNTIRDFLKQAAFPIRMDEEKLQKQLADSLAQGKDLLVHGLKYLKLSDFREGLERIECPALIIHGHKDRIVPWRAAQWMHEQLDNSEFLEFKRGGHLLLAQYGEEICSATADFLRVE